jgi:uncharacterized membrane protein YgcG
MMRRLILAACLVLVPLGAVADEVINRFEVDVDVERDADIVVTETITVTAENIDINRGIFRDLPRYYRFDQGEHDVNLPYDYDVLSVRRDGERERYETEGVGNAYRVRIGDPDIFLPRGQHVYEIRYRVKNEVRYFDDHDEIYWNVTGSYWQFPIEEVIARIELPEGAEGAEVLEHTAFVGGFGETRSDYSYRQQGNTHIFETDGPLAEREGFSIVLTIEKGVIDPPSASDQATIWWQLYGSLAVLIASLIGVFAFLYRSWVKVGRDPPRLPVFARYEAPKGYSPAAVHHIYHRGFSGHDALTAALVNLGIKGVVDIDARDKTDTRLTPKGKPARRLPGEEDLLERKLLSDGEVTLGGEYNKDFTSAYQAFRKRLSDKFGGDYFKWNLGYTIAAVVLSAVAIIFAIVHAPEWSLWLTILIVAIALMNGLFMYLMPAATPKGEKVRSEIEGFKLYLETAEKLQLNTARPGEDSPPAMTKDRYEAFLPYAIALGVEKPWTKHFEKRLPKEAADYNPGWSAMGHGTSASLHSMTRSVTSNISSAVSNSMPQSSSSSGSGGGGFSGGGGGGGGGGGW